jgi:hypothetical protein
MVTKKKSKSASGDGKSSSLNSKIALTLALASIGAMWIYGITGMAMAYLALRVAERAAEEYKSAGGKYGKSTVGNIKKSRVFAYLGMFLGGTFFLLCLTKWILAAL